MNCPYCRASNCEDDHRCRRCGRRLASEGLRSAGVPRFQHAATAEALSFEASEQTNSEPGAQAAPQRLADARPRRPVYQPSLFGSREIPRVVSFESFAPESVDTAPKKPSRARAKTRRAMPGQQSFGFEPAPATYYGGASPVEPAIACDAPVALPAHRIMAAAMDAILVIIAASLFIAVFRMAGGPIVMNKHTLPLLLGIVTVFYLMYKVLWCLADGDTAGMNWAHLKVVNFDGQAPDREQRLFRIAAGCLSLLAAGLGLIWALVDEEALTWHDHISKTFPTPY